ncbi:MAG: LysR family transcriptional regulator [Clostridia bacterium]|nr:LysR family transcriptional regulator [Clostridia bacterium]
MNLLHMKYAVEVSKTKSISRAAENLYMGQPNLSRAIKELEESLGITIFDRNSKGIEVTEEGEEFLQYAHRILNQVDEIEAIYRGGKKQKQQFSVCAPHATYIAKAFSQMIKATDHDNPLEFFYKEADAIEAINNVSVGEYDIGVVRFQTTFEQYYKQHFEFKNLAYEDIFTFSPVLFVSKESPLASKESITLEDLQDYIEVLHEDPYIPAPASSTSVRAVASPQMKKRIYIFERCSQYTLLKDVPDSFVLSSPVSQSILDEHNLVQKNVVGSAEYKDVLIYRKNYNLSSLDNSFIAHVKSMCEQLF